MKEEPGGYLGRSGPVLGKCVSPVSDSKEAAVARDREKGPEEDWIRSEDGDFPGGPVVQNPSAMQGTRAQSLVREDPTCFRTTTTEACEPTACALQHKKPLQ